MKVIRHFIRWLAKVFKADITIRETVVKTIVEHLPPEGGVIEGDLHVTGSLTATGSIAATGGIACKDTCEEGKEVRDGQQ